MRNVLSLLIEVKTKNEFIEKVIKGFASNLESENRQKCIKEIADFLQAPIDSMDFIVKDDKFTKIEFLNEPTQKFSDPMQPPIIKTVELQRYLSITHTWITSGEPFIIVGAEGSGKNILIRESLTHL